MKNRAVQALVALTILFVGMTIGFSLGRRVTKAPIHVNIVQEPAVSVCEPTDETASPSSAPAEETKPDAVRVNVNTADLDTLCSLPGIGPVLAQRIIDYRTANGPFSSVEELTMVQGIGSKKLDAIRNLVVTGG